MYVLIVGSSQLTRQQFSIFRSVCSNQARVNSESIMHTAFTQKLQILQRATKTRKEHHMKDNARAGRKLEQRALIARRCRSFASYFTKTR